MSRFEGRRVLVTGAVSGIGLATSRLFLEEGAEVAMADFRGEVVERARTGLRRTERSPSLTVDVRDRAGVEDAAGLPHVGAGLDLEASFEPAVLDARGLRVAFLGIACTLPGGFAAGPGRPGVAPIRIFSRLVIDAVSMDENPGMSPYVETVPMPGDVERAAEAVCRVRSEADLVVVGIHLGRAQRLGVPDPGRAGDLPAPARPRPRRSRRRRRDRPPSARAPRGRVLSGQAYLLQSWQLPLSLAAGRGSPALAQLPAIPLDVAAKPAQPLWRRRQGDLERGWRAGAGGAPAGLARRGGRALPARRGPGPFRGGARGPALVGAGCFGRGTRW